MSQIQRTTPDGFATQLTRLIAAELFLVLGMHAARDLFGKGYFALGAGEKQIVDQTVQVLVWANLYGVNT